MSSSVCIDKGHGAAHHGIRVLEAAPHGDLKVRRWRGPNNENTRRPLSSPAALLALRALIEANGRLSTRSRPWPQVAKLGQVRHEPGAPEIAKVSKLPAPVAFASGWPVKIAACSVQLASIPHESATVP